MADALTQSHQEWLGYVQPVGVVISIPALTGAGIGINRNSAPLHREFVSLLPWTPESFPAFAARVLDWRASDLTTPSDNFTVAVPGYDDVLRPTWLVQDNGKPLLLIEQTAADDLDKDDPAQNGGWKASPQMRFERLLRETGVPIGLLLNGEAIRLVYAPKGESSGHITFQIAEMAQIAGRPILAALHMLLGQDRLFVGHEAQRLPKLLEASRKHQNEVSTKLSGQVMEALFELLRGLQRAHDESNGELLEEVLQNNPNLVYSGLLTVLLRLVFILYAEDRGLLSSDPIFVNHYSINGLFESLREDGGRYADTMDSRFGAWARLISVFRLIYQGAKHGESFRIPGRKGYLFDPDRFPFLKGRNGNSTPHLPRISDGVVYRVLSKLLLLDGERLSYRALDVEQIGSVYEAMMGFRLERASGRSIAIKAKKKHGAPVTVDLDDALRTSPAKRREWLKKAADVELGTAADRLLKQAETIDDLLTALDRRTDKKVTPDVVPAGSLIFQPSPERRSSGSHYTPRSLTAPIVQATLEPMLKNLGETPTPDQILALKVCDPAMGSGAFLVEACRQLADALVEAWHIHKQTPPLPPDEDELLNARRVIAQRCLYGVDKNEVAVDLARLSLWLATLARDHEFTFLDHALRHGDSLLGLTARQIAAFDWRIDGARWLHLETELRLRIKRASEAREQILSANEDVHYSLQAQKLALANQELEIARMAGDLVLLAFFSGQNKTQRVEALDGLRAGFRDYLEGGNIQLGVQLQERRSTKANDSPALIPFHWEIEFPEVFRLDAALHPRSAFHAIVGNPPFAGRNLLIQANAPGYLDWLQCASEETKANADLSAYFFRQAFRVLTDNGCFGLISTKTIYQGESRYTGLRWIRSRGGCIYRAFRQLTWPGESANVVISIVHVSKAPVSGPYWLDGRHVDLITAYLFHAGPDDDPHDLAANSGLASEGTKIYSPGFTFDDSDPTGASPMALMQELLEKDRRNAERIKPYLGGDEVNKDPEHAHYRYVIDLEDFPLERIDEGFRWTTAGKQRRKDCLKRGVVPIDYPSAVARDWPDLIEVIERKVRPYRLSQSDAQARRLWWRFQRTRKRLYEKLRDLREALVVGCGASPHLALAFVPTGQVFSHSLVVFPTDRRGFFAILQSRTHELWAWRESSSHQVRLRYTHSSCFHSFPLPEPTRWNELDKIGAQYHDVRALFMKRAGIGLTAIYNRFHDPANQTNDVKALRAAHQELDAGVLKAYGWDDVSPRSEFIREHPPENDEDGGEGGDVVYRYRWPDEIRDEVLARLLELNQQRALEQGDIVLSPADDEEEVDSEPEDDDAQMSLLGES